MSTQTVADGSPAMRPRSARSVMLSCGIVLEASEPSALALCRAPAVSVVRGVAAGREQATRNAQAASDRSRIEGIRRGGSGGIGTVPNERTIDESYAVGRWLTNPFATTVCDMEDAGPYKAYVLHPRERAVTSRSRE